MSVFSDMKNAFKKIGNLDKEVRNIWNKIKGVENVANNAVNEVKKVGGVANDAINEAKKAAQKVEDLSKKFGVVEKEFKNFGKQVENLPNTIKNEAEKVIDTWVDDIGKALTKEALKKTRDILKTAHTGMNSLEDREALIEASNSLSAYIELGPVTLTWSDFWLRANTIIAELDKYVNRPPSINRKEIKRLIEALGPTTINFGFSVNFALVIGSKELGVGGGIGDVPLKLFTEIADVILDKCGVPN